MGRPVRRPDPGGAGVCVERPGAVRRPADGRLIFEPTPLPGAFLITPERLHDERGFFARTFCRRDFEAHGLNPAVAQCNISVSARRGTLRGMHYQRPPHAEAKLIRCTAGAIYDVIIDLRPILAGLPAALRRPARTVR